MIRLLRAGVNSLLIVAGFHGAATLMAAEVNTPPGTEAPATPGTIPPTTPATVVPVNPLPAATQVTPAAQVTPAFPVTPVTQVTPATAVTPVAPVVTTPPAAEATPAVAANTPPPDINNLDYDDCMDDEGFVTPVKQNLDHLEAGSEQQKRFMELADKFNAWPEKPIEDKFQKVRSYINLAAIVDIGHGEFEGETAYIVFERLKKEIPKEELIKLCYQEMLKYNEGKVELKMENFGFENPCDEADLRERMGLYAKKLLGRLQGKLPPKATTGP